MARLRQSPRPSDLIVSVPPWLPSKQNTRPPPSSEDGSSGDDSSDDADQTEVEDQSDGETNEEGDAGQSDEQDTEDEDRDQSDGEDGDQIEGENTEAFKAGGEDVEQGTADTSKDEDKTEVGEEMAISESLDEDGLQQTIIARFEQRLFDMRKQPAAQAAILFKTTHRQLVQLEGSMKDYLHSIWSYAEMFGFAEQLGFDTFEDLVRSFGDDGVSASLSKRSLAYFDRLKKAWGADFYTKLDWPVPASTNLLEKLCRISKTTAIEVFVVRVKQIMEERLGARQKWQRLAVTIVVGDIIKYEKLWRTKKAKVWKSKKGEKSTDDETELEDYGSQPADTEPLSSPAMSSSLLRANMSARRNPARAAVILGSPASPELGRRVPVQEGQEHGFEEDSYMLQKCNGSQDMNRPEDNGPSFQDSGHDALCSPVFGSLLEPSPVFEGFSDEQSPAKLDEQIATPVGEHKAIRRFINFDVTSDIESNSTHNVSPSLESHSLSPSPQTPSRIIDLSNSSSPSSHRTGQSLEERYEYARQNLEGNGMLHDDTITLCLEQEAVRASSDVAILHCLYFSINDRKSDPSKAGTIPRILARRIPRPWIFLTSVNDAGHWMLVLIDLRNGSIDVYDSWQASSRVQQRFEELVAHCSAWMKSSNPDLATKTIQSRRMSCAQQNDSVSCGLFCVAFGKALLKGKEVPTTLGRRELQQFRSELAQQLGDARAELESEGRKVNSPAHSEADLPDLKRTVDGSGPEPPFKRAKSEGTSMANSNPHSNPTISNHPTTTLPSAMVESSNTLQLPVDPSLAVLASAEEAEAYWSNLVLRAESKLECLQEAQSVACQSFVQLCGQVSQHYAVPSSTKKGRKDQSSKHQPSFDPQDIEERATAIASATNNMQRAKSDVQKAEDAVQWMRQRLEQSKKTVEVCRGAAKEAGEFRARMSAWEQLGVV